MERECLWERLFINSMSHYSIADRPTTVGKSRMPHIFVKAHR